MGAGKGITLLVLNKNINDIFRIIKSLGNSSALADGISENAKP